MKIALSQNNLKLADSLAQTNLRISHSNEAGHDYSSRNLFELAELRFAQKNVRFHI